METIDLKTMSDSDLVELSRNINAEQDRRAALVSIPVKIQELQNQFIEYGGNPADLG